MKAVVVAEDGSSASPTSRAGAARSRSGEFETFECDTVIYALGTRANPVISRSAPDLAVRGEGYVNADPKTQATNLPGVFAGGDIVTGGATVILALGAGRRAARAIEKYLTTKEWPVVLDEEAAPGTASRPGPGRGRLHEVPAPLRAGRRGAHLLRRRADHLDLHLLPEGLGRVRVPLRPLPRLRRRPSSWATTSSARVRGRRRRRSGRPSRSSWAASPSTPAARRRSRRRTPTSRTSSASCPRWRRGTWRSSPAATTSQAPEEALTQTLTPAQVAIFAGADVKDYSGASLLRLAVHLEKRARAFFLDAGRKFPTGSHEWKLYRELEAEEREHVDMLSTVLARIVAEKPVVV